MSFFDKLTWWIKPDAPAPVVRATAGASLSGRPTYVSSTGVSQVLSRQMEFSLLAQYYRSIPAMTRAIHILSGFCGTPEFVTKSDAATTELNAWANGVAVGQIGFGLAFWLKDFLAQGLSYGYGVGEAQLSANRNEIERLWVYASPSCGFRTDAAGGLEVVQTGSGGLKALDPLTVLSMTHSPSASDPNGQALFYSVPTAAQTWLDILYAFRATWRRSGIPIYHVDIRLQDTLDDPEGNVAGKIVSDYETAWNEAMRSQVQDGLAKDFITCTVNGATVRAIGAETALIDIQVSKRQILEEIVIATGIPPWLLGYAWSTTERLSTQQADMLIAGIDDLRREAEGAIRKLVSLRQRIAARRGALDFEIVWPEVNLQDRIETARAVLMEAQAEEARERVARVLWSNGVYTQAQYAESTTGSEDIAQAQDTPAVPPQGATPANLGALSRISEAEKLQAIAEETREAYGGHYKHACKANADDPVQVLPNEQPQYEGLRRELARAWNATRQAFADLREGWFSASGLDDPGKAVKRLSNDQRQAIEQAAREFLRTFAGSDRTANGYAAASTEDGILQQASVSAWHAGVNRGASLLEMPTNPAFNQTVRQSLLNDSFARLSEDGRLRFETRLYEIRDKMMQGFASGTNPLEIARQLGKDLDGYEAGRLRTIVRTEMGEAAETGIRQTYKENRITRVTFLVDPNTDSLCTAHIDQVVSIDDPDMPPWHPNCYCTAIPVVES